MSASDYAFGRASGNHSDDCHFLLYRSPAGQPFEPDCGESWIMYMDDEGTTSIMKHAGWYTSLWRAPSGLCYVTEANGYIQSMLKSTEDLASYEVGGMLRGIWGLSDDDIWAWGTRGNGDFIVSWDDGDWVEQADPGGYVLALHGRAADDLWVVGGDGFASRFDGKRWKRVKTPTKEYLVSVFAGPNGEVWASGTEGSLLRSKDGGAFEQVLKHDAALQSVVVWRGEVWVGASGSLALCSLDHGKLKERLEKFSNGVLLEPHDGALLIVGEGIIGHSEDGTEFCYTTPDDPGELCDDHVPPWEDDDSGDEGGSDDEDSDDE